MTMQEVILALQIVSMLFNLMIIISLKRIYSELEL